jgi:cell volume regulation protein A
MSDVSLTLLAVAGVFLVGSVGEIVFARTRIPDVVWLILCGLALGPVSGVLDAAALLRIAPYFAAFALVVILFNGGSSLQLEGVAKAAPRAVLLALLGFGIAAAAVAAASMLGRRLGLFPPAWTWLHGAMLGAIVGGSSSIIILPAMATSKTDRKIADLLSLESTFTDALCVVAASTTVSLLLQKGHAGAANAALEVGRQFGVAFGIGVAAGLVWLLLLNVLRAAEHAYPITLASLLLLYVLIDSVGASAAMGVLTFAVIVGNARLFSRKLGLVAEIDLGLGVRGFHAQVAFIVKSFFFVLIGALLRPPWGLVALGAALGVVLLVVRVPAVWVATLAGRFGRRERAIMTVALPRGMAAGVMATIPAAAGVVATEGLSTIVFACIVSTIAIFAIGMPLASRGLRPPRAEPAPDASAQSEPPPERAADPVDGTG